MACEDCNAYYLIRDTTGIVQQEQIQVAVVLLLLGGNQSCPGGESHMDMMALRPEEYATECEMVMLQSTCTDGVCQRRLRLWQLL